MAPLNKGMKSIAWVSCYYLKIVFYVDSSQGHYDLPEGVKICTLSQTALRESPDNFRVVSDLPRNLMSPSVQPIAENRAEPLELVQTYTRPGSHHPGALAVYMEHHQPFSWIQHVDWHSISKYLPSCQQPNAWQYLFGSQIDAAFYPPQRAAMVLPNADKSLIPLLYVITSHLNNISPLGHVAMDDLYSWAKLLPPQLVSSFLKALRAPFLDALRERIFVAAVSSGELDIVSAMLALELDPNEKIITDSPSRGTPVSPLEFAIYKGHFLVAKTITTHISKRANPQQLDDLLDQLNYCEETRPTNSLRDVQMVELLCIPLSWGATPSVSCLAAANCKFRLAKQLIEASGSNLGSWVKADLLRDCLSKKRYFFGQEQLVSRIFSYVLVERLHLLPARDQNFRMALFCALHCAVQARRVGAAEMILSTLHALGYHTIRETVHDSSGNCSIRQAFQQEQWDLATSLIELQIHGIDNETQSQDLPSYDPDHARLQQDALSEELNGAISQRNISYAQKILDGFDLDDLHLRSAVDQAVDLGHDLMAAMIVQHMEEETGEAFDNFMFLLRLGRVQAVSALLRNEPRWRLALDAVNRSGDFGALEDIVYSTPSRVRYANSCMSHTPIDGRQISLRAVAYYAMETNDHNLFKWLLESGMDTDELIYNNNNGVSMFISKRPITHGGFGGLREPADHESEVLPSLLAIAAERNDLPWMRFLLTQGVDRVDSMALTRAIKVRAKPATVHLLLETARSWIRKPCSNYTYGAAALREAIRQRNMPMIDMLCKDVDLDAVEASTEEILHDKQILSPMGEAILTNDPDLVQALLSHGASPNACVAHDGLKLLKHVDSWIPRVTPILTAIDIQSLALVKLLVENGAEIGHTRRCGTLRTPLQRASEIGNFDIVRYLIGQGAPVDTVPVHSGGTALQLAAMSGHVGIATFLLEHGANPNYPPAMGDGRTAFELAAEWARIDMMSLLMQWGVQLDLQVGDGNESQYQRACQFAEDNGYMASKRFVKHLYEGATDLLSMEDAQALGLAERSE
jgi:ankyrin repeat protein